jgi:glycosyltransferase involved in cell wall biosynthesis
LVAFLFPQSHLKKAVFIEKLLLKRALKKSQKIITVSENTKKDLIEKFKIDGQKIITVPCAASDGFLTDTSPKDTFLPEKFFLSVGTIEPRKNYETLIQAFAMFHKTNPEHHLIIAGKKGWGTIDLDELITSNYLQKYVHILGYITNKSLNKLYNQAQAFIFPSYYEGFGIPPLEALKCGCPVISSYTSSMPEVLGEAAIFCDPSQPAEFTKAMEKIVSDANLRTELINKGRIQSNKFSWTSSAEKLKSNCYG